jgi:crossover junction endodeoxyribonuclease RuvC
VTLVIGVDPGKRGAVAFLDGYGEVRSIADMPVVANKVSPMLLTDLIDDNLCDDPYSITAVVEQVHSMPKQGVASSFDFGTSYGIVLGVLAGARIRTEHVTPSRWKRDMRLTADKEQARRRATERWPGNVGLFARKLDADRAEAALIALWWIERTS